METTETNVESLEARLVLWRSKLDELLAEADQGDADTNAEYRSHIEDLKVQHEAAQAMLDEIRAAGDDKWQGLKPGAEHIWDALEIAFNKLNFLN